MTANDAKRKVKMTPVFILGPVPLNWHAGSGFIGPSSQLFLFHSFSIFIFWVIILLRKCVTLISTFIVYNQEDVYGVTIPIKTCNHEYVCVLGLQCGLHDMWFWSYISQSSPKFQFHAMKL